jgi:hypothetical protein
LLSRTPEDMGPTFDGHALLAYARSGNTVVSRSRHEIATSPNNTS